MSKYRVGIIGCGNIFTMHATSIVHLEETELVAVCDNKHERLERVKRDYPDAKGYTDYKQMIDSENLDAVHICTPHYLHTEMARYAFSKGVHVLSEKPMSISYEDAVKTVEYAEKCKKLYGVIFQCRYNNASQTVKKYLDNKSLGKIYSARVVLTWHRPESYYALSDWKGRWDKEGGGVMIDQCIHSMDLANWFIGDEPISVKASLQNRNHFNIEVEDTAEGFIRYKNGATLTFFAMNNYAVDEPIEIRLYCENGTVKMSYDDAEIKFKNGEIVTVSKDAENIVYKNGKDYWGFQHVKQIQNFYAALSHKENLDIPAREALKIQKIITDIYACRNNA